MAQMPPMAVVELFTSQACSSCPMTDAMISGLSRREDVIVLTLPVDYWNYTGWRDTLSLKAHTARQRGYAAAWGHSFLATPQIIVNGIQAMKEHDKPSVERMMEKLSRHSGALNIPVTLSRNMDLVEIGIPAAPFHRRASIWLSTVSRNRSVFIEAGENSGRTLKYSHVARSWTKLGEWQGEAKNYFVPLSSLRHDGVDRLVVLLQAGTATEMGPILGAAALNIPEQPPNMKPTNDPRAKSGKH